MENNKQMQNNNNYTQNKIETLLNFLNDQSDIKVFNKSQNYSMLGYLLLLAIKIIIFDCVYFKNQDYSIINSLYMKHILIIILFTLIYASMKFNKIRLTSSVYFENLRDIGIAVFGFAFVVIWTQLFINIQNLYKGLGVTFGFQIAIFLQIAALNIRRNWIKIIFTIFSIVEVSIRVCFEDYHIFSQTLILVLLFSGFYCSQKPDYHTSLQSITITAIDSNTINDKIFAEERKIVIQNKNQEFLLQSPNSSGQKISNKQLKNRKSSSWKSSITEIDINRTMFLNAIIEIFNEGLVLVNRNFETIYSNKWIEEKFTKQVFQELNYCQNEEIMTLKDKLIEMELKNYESIENLYLPCVFSKILGTLSLRLFRGFLGQNLVYMCHITQQKSQTLMNTPKIYQQLQSINIQNLLVADSRNDTCQKYRFLFQKDLLGIRKNKTYFINRYLVKITNIKSAINQLFKEVKASFQFLQVAEEENQEFECNIQLLVYFTYCVYTISKQKLNKMIITFRKNKLIYSFCKTDQLYITFLEMLIQKICQKVKITSESIELTFANPADSIFEMQMAYQKYIPELIPLKQGMYKQNIQISQIQQDSFKKFNEVPIYILQENSDYIEQKLRNLGFLRLTKIPQTNLGVLQSNSLLVADINDIKQYLKDKKLTNKCLITISNYFSCPQNSFIPLNNDNNFMTPIYFVQLQLVRVLKQLIQVRQLLINK